MTEQAGKHDGRLASVTSALWRLQCRRSVPQRRIRTGICPFGVQRAVPVESRMDFTLDAARLGRLIATRSPAHIARMLTISKFRVFVTGCPLLIWSSGTHGKDRRNVACPREHEPRIVEAPAGMLSSVESDMRILSGQPAIVGGLREGAFHLGARHST